jgi:tetratricopeptide (TPR) repeat protein
MKKILFTLALLISFSSFGQTKVELELCIAMQSSNFMSDSEAENALNKILNTIGASKNFVLTPCSNINNAAATSYKGIRYILYDKEFMQSINSKTNNWSSLAILAHEIGHHINGHALDITMYLGGVVEAESLANQRKQELEADEFAGFVLARLGANLNSALAFTEIFIEKDDTYDTHPTKSKRVNAVRKGFNKAGGDSTLSNTNNAPTEYTQKNSNMSVEEYYNRGVERQNSKNYNGAISDYTNAIRIKPDYGSAYFGRAYSKDELKDYYGAIADYTKAIELIPNESNAYYNRGISKSNTKDHYGAIADYTKAIELNPNYTNAYYNRGISKNNLKDYYGAISDYNKTIELIPNFSKAYYSRGNSKSNIKDYYGAIADYTKAIELDPNYRSAYKNRGINKENLGDLNGACADWKKAARLGDADAAKWVANQCN